MKVRSRSEETPKILLSFGEGLCESGRVPAARIFEELTKAKIWYTVRGSPTMLVNAVALFYQAEAGVRGYATVRGIAAVNPQDQRWLAAFGLRHLRVKLLLESVVVFRQPVALGPIVQKLNFVANKTYWGRALAADVSIGKTQRVVADMQQMKDLSGQIGAKISLEKVLHD
jgi:hypothetical protein